MKTISKQVLLSLLGSTIVVFGIWGYLEFMRTMKHDQEKLRRNQQTIAERIAYNLVSPLWHMNRAEVGKTIHYEAVDEIVRAILVYDDSDDLYSGAIRDELGHIEAYDDKNPQHRHLLTLSSGSNTHEILNNRTAIGKVTLWVNDAHLQSALRQRLINLLFTLFALIAAIAGVMFFMLHKVVIQPLTLLKGWVMSIGSGPPPPLPQMNHCEEIDILAASFSEMAGRLINGKKELEISHRLIRSVMDNTFQLQGLLSPDGKLLDVNETALRIINVSRESVLGRNFWHTPWWNHDPAISERVRQAVAGAARGEFIRYETVHIDASGELHDIDFSMKPVSDAAGNIIYLIPEGRDITERKQAESALRASEERLNNLYQESPIPTFTWQKKGDDFILVDFNHAAIEISNGKVAAHLGGSAVELYKDSPQILDDMHLCFQERSLVRREVTSPHFALGRHLSVYYGFIPPDLIIVNTDDQTERKRAEETIRKSEAHYRDLVETSQDLIWECGVDGRYTYLNPAWEQIFGYKVEEMLGKRFVDFQTPECAERDLKEFARLLQGNTVKGLETMHIGKDGRAIHLVFNAKCLVDAQGNPAGTIGTAYDITERKQVEEALRRSEEKFAKAFHASPMIVQISSISNGRVIEVNEAFEKVMGYTREEALASTTIDLGFWVNPAERERLLQILLAKGRLRDEEAHFLTKRGEVIICQLSAELIELDGEAFTLTVSENITERKRAAAEREALQAQLLQAQKMEAIGTLAGGIAHDFNNILGGIMGYTELSLRHHLRPDHPATEYLQEVLRASTRAKDLVAQIVTFSRQTEQMRRPLDVGPIIKESLKLLRASLPPTIEIQQHIDAAAGIIQADPTQIHQIILNLCTNAYHAMREKRGIIEVSLNRVIFGAEKPLPLDLKQGVEYQVLTVRDTGHGIEQAIIDRIFDPFFTTKKTGEGTGLGLSVVYGIVKSHDGAIAVESMPDQGTTFRIYIPTIDKPHAEAEEHEKVLTRGTEKIIFVDDDKALTYIFRTQLENLGYIVYDYNDPVEALADFKNNATNYDLVITDKTMPHMDGIELARSLIEIKPDIPVILCTGAIDNMEQTAWEKGGIRKVLRKPLKINVMTEAIRRVLDAR